MQAFEEKEYNKNFNFGLWKKMFQFIKPYKKYVFALCFFMISLAGIDAIFPMMTKIAIDEFIVPGKLEGITNFAIKYFVLVIWQSLNVFVFITIAGKLEMELTYDIRKKAYAKLQELSFSYYDKTPLGWIMARMTSDIRRLGEIISWGIVDMVWGLSMMICIAGFMFYYNLKLAIISLSVIPILIIISIIFQKKILVAYRIVRKTNSKITGAFSEGISGAKTTKTLVREAENLKEFKELTGEMRRSSISAAIFSALFLPIVLTLGSIGTGFVIWFGGNDVIVRSLSYGTLVLFISYTTQFFEPVRELARVLAELQNAQASAERVLSLIETETDVKDKSHVIKNYGDINNPKAENWPSINGYVEFKDVNFKYQNGEEVLNNFNLKIKAGETIALVGETGSGKSTIVNLICRFYEPTEGEVLIDGVDYRERSIGWLHSNLGYVLQTPHLFSGSIKDNIRYGKLDSTEDEIINAAKLVNAHNFIVDFEKGYDTDVGEGGGKLSTGEKQLVSFARAMIANPRIFILDEATSSIDTHTEKIIQDAIQVVLNGRTSFIIAHRLSTIVSADRILVIKNGKIIEEGNHKTLLKNKGYYYSLYTNQFKEEIINKDFKGVQNDKI